MGRLVVSFVCAGLLACGPFSSAALYGTSLRGAANAPVVTTTTRAGQTYSRPVGLAPAPGAPVGSGIVRYRLLLGENPVDGEGAHRCYAGCREAASEDELLTCLSECPGFEVQVGVTCGPGDGLPRSICFTRGTGASGTEASDPGWLVLAILADMALYVGLASTCDDTDCTGGGPCSCPW
jgi:hypothetical protein